MNPSKNHTAERVFVPRFDQVDTSDPDACAAFLDLAHSLEGVRRWKRISFDLLDIKQGDRILDIGCGTGADATALATLVGAAGRVVGVDRSQAFVTLALRRAAPLGLPVTFLQADIHALPFENESFGRTRIDRVLHFLPDPNRALRETMRVTSRGGRIVVTEPDWRTLIVEGGDDRLGTVILAGSTTQPGAAIGSRLATMMRQVGLQVDDCHDATLEITDYPVAATLFALEAIAGQAVKACRASPGEAVSWLRSLQQASNRSELRCRLTGAIVSGTRI
jgi:SAM-dependent methyltransferase